VQIIVVDDNSDVKEVNGISLQTLPERYPNIEFIWGKNEDGRKGAGYARNLGLERAKGKWLIFADADDFFMPCFNEVLDKYIDDENEIIYFYVTSADSDTLKPTTRHQYIIDCMKKVQQTNDWETMYQVNVPWGRLIKRKTVKDNCIQFQETSYANDVLFGLKLTNTAKKKIISHNEIYCVTSRVDSMMGNNTTNSMLVRFQTCCDAVDYLNFSKKGHCFANITYWWWTRIYLADKKTAMKSLLKMGKTIGISYMFQAVTFTVKKQISCIKKWLLVIFKN